MKQIQTALLASAIGLMLYSTNAKADLVVVDSQAAKKPVPVLSPRPSQPNNLIISGEDSVPSSYKALPAPVTTASVRTIVPTSEVSSRQQGRLVMVGSPAPSPALKGWADNVPLSLALNQVVPSGFKVVKQDGFDDSVQVSWKGGKSWTSILSALTFGYKFDAKVDWVKQVVEIGRVGSIQPVAVASKEPSKEVAAPLVERTVVSPVVTASPAPVALPPPPPVVKTFTTNPQLTLRENVEAWAEQESRSTGVKWTVVWEGANYPVAASATFTGDFKDPNGPIATIISAYEDSNQPLYVVITGRDKVIQVKNKNYTPASIIPNSPSDMAPGAFVR